MLLLAAPELFTAQKLLLLLELGERSHQFVAERLTAQNLNLNQILKSPFISVFYAGYQLCFSYGETNNILNPFPHIWVFLIYDVQLIEKCLQRIVSFREMIAP